MKLSHKYLSFAKNNDTLKRREVDVVGVLYRTALVLVIIGAINWGLIGFFRFDLVAALFGGQTAAFSRIIYALVGLSGLLCIPLLFKPMDEDINESTGSYRKMNPQTEVSKEENFDDYKK